MLVQKIQDDLKASMKEGRAFELGVLRMLSASLHNKSIEKRGKGGDGELGDEEVLDALRKEAKKRREAAELYEKGNRPELRNQEIKEAEFIEQYLPKPMSEAEVEAAVVKILGSGIKEMGPAMKEVMRELKGRADGRIVQELIKKHLS